MDHATADNKQLFKIEENSSQRTKETDNVGSSLPSKSYSTNGSLLHASSSPVKKKTNSTRGSFFRHTLFNRESLVQVNLDSDGDDSQNMAKRMARRSILQLKRGSQSTRSSISSSARTLIRTHGILKLICVTSLLLAAFAASIFGGAIAGRRWGGDVFGDTNNSKHIHILSTSVPAGKYTNTTFPSFVPTIAPSSMSDAVESDNHLSDPSHPTTYDSTAPSLKPNAKISGLGKMLTLSPSPTHSSSPTLRPRFKISASPSKDLTF